MRHGWRTYISQRPGGWPRKYGNAPQEGKPQLIKYQPSHIHWWHAIVGTVLVIYPFFFYGFAFSAAFFGYFLVFMGAVWLFNLLQYLFSGGMPARASCVWPQDATRDLRRGYFDLMLAITVVWAVGALGYVYCLLALNVWMISPDPMFQSDLPQKGPAGMVAIIQVIGEASWLVMVSGFLWWPMFAFFEWPELQSKRKSRNGSPGRTHA